jgi:hypothetical protein
VAEHFEFLGSTATDELIGGGKTRPIRLASARAIPSGVQFTLPIAVVDFEPTKLEIILNTVAEALNKDAAVDGVDDINVYQDVSPSGQFVNKVTVSVVSSSGNSDETISVPYGAIFDARFEAAVKKAVANMDAVEAL